MTEEMLRMIEKHDEHWRTVLKYEKERMKEITILLCVLTAMTFIVIGGLIGSHLGGDKINNSCGENGEAGDSMNARDR